jgi:hypothetical protein
VKIAGRRYVTDRRLASILNVTTRTLARWNGTRTKPSAAPGPDSAEMHIIKSIAASRDLQSLDFPGKYASCNRRHLRLSRCANRP